MHDYDAVAHPAEYAALQRLQSGLLRLPVGFVPSATRLFATGPLARVAQRAYWRLADPDRLELAPGVRSAVRGGARPVRHRLGR